MKLYAVKNMAAPALLARVVELEYGLSSLPRLERGDRGKPFFPDCPQIRFSLSHSGALTLCGVDGLPVGADIEEIRPRSDALPRYAFTASEYEDWLRRGGDWAAFCAVWTRKEAWCKHTGKGLLAQWKQCPPQEGVFWGEYAGDGWRAALCGHTPPPEEIFWLSEEENTP